MTRPGVPRDTFAAACRAVGAGATVGELEAATEDLLARWSEPHRGYHDTEHLGEVLARLDDLGAASPVAVLTAWFHDAVYAGEPGDDERASAALARTVLGRLGVGPRAIGRIADLVLATVDHDRLTSADDPERDALLDADLAVLAAPPDRYRRYVEGVRAEYAHVDDAAFARGRAAVLMRLVRRPSIFATVVGRGLWEEHARAQVTAEIDELGRALGRSET